MDEEPPPQASQAPFPELKLPYYEHYDPRIEITPEYASRNSIDLSGSHFRLSPEKFSMLKRANILFPTFNTNVSLLKGKLSSV